MAAVGKLATLVDQQPPRCWSPRATRLACTERNRCCRSQPGNTRCRRRGADLPTTCLAPSGWCQQVRPRRGCGASAPKRPAGMAVLPHAPQLSSIPIPAANDDRPAPIRDTSGPSSRRRRLVPGGGSCRTAWLRIPRSAQLVSVEAVTAWLSSEWPGAARVAVDGSHCDGSFADRTGNSFAELRTSPAANTPGDFPRMDRAHAPAPSWYRVYHGRSARSRPCRG